MCSWKNSMWFVIPRYEFKMTNRNACWSFWLWWRSQGSDMLLDLYTETLMNIKQMANNTQDVDIGLKQTAIWIVLNMNRMCGCKIIL